ncbi:MAG: NUDIX hydrolase [Verrucomicrobiae bacterium]|nr:NUDIX hydrolase [Verrucomicrobiae bacterium]MDW8307928.1 NUDIX hydrolase [Verrucomicrobiales bacterium]
MHIRQRRVEFTTPWFQIVAKNTGDHTAPHYALRTLDYVSVVAFTPQRELALVRQFRPAVECVTLELPGGHVDAGETPEAAARRELAEECGLHAPQLECLGVLLSDTGRIENRLWCFFARETARVDGFRPETDVQPVFVPAAALTGLLLRGEFNHALNLAALLLAVARHGPALFALK